MVPICLSAGHLEVSSKVLDELELSQMDSRWWDGLDLLLPHQPCRRMHTLTTSLNE